MWLFFAILSAIFASLTAILAKIGLDGINSNLATAIRTGVVLILSWGIVFAMGAQKGIAVLSKTNWVFLTLSGLCTGFSWLCYYKALQIGHVSKVAPVDKLSVVFTVVLAIILFHEPFTAKTIIGLILLAAGIVTLL